MHEAKRPRLTGSFSPASPPYHLAKGIEQRHGGFQQPQTPTSPPAQSMSSIPTSASATSTTNTQLTEDTPASSIAGLKNEDDVDMPMAEDGSLLKADGHNKQAVSHMRTDHERIQDGVKVISSGTQDEIQDFLLNIDVGPLYKLCEKPYPSSTPHPSQNLFSLYDLQDIATSVARKDPVTGEKINKLRKSYEGKIKELGITGRNKAEDGQGDFETLMAWPEQPYVDQRVTGKEIRRGLDADFDAKLKKVLRIPMPQARLPEAEHARWTALLGTDEPAKPSAVTASHAPQQMMANVRIEKRDRPGGAMGGRGGLHRTASATGRPERSNKKRSYHDSSFSGYGEGFGDDGLDASDDEALSVRRKRMKA